MHGIKKWIATYTLSALMVAAEIVGNAGSVCAANAANAANAASVGGVCAANAASVESAGSACAANAANVGSAGSVCAANAASVESAGSANAANTSIRPAAVQAMAQAQETVTAQPIANAKIALNKTSVTLIKGQTVQLKLSGTEEETKWSSSDKSVATVTAAGKVTAKAKGTAKIYAKAGGKKYTCTITVETPKLNKTSLSIQEGKTTKLTLSGTSREVRWTSSDKTIARVSSTGKVRGIKAGECKITAKVGNKKYICKVTVVRPDEPEQPQPETSTDADKQPETGTKTDVGKQPEGTRSLTEQQVYEAITAMQEQYPDGTPWTNENYYEWKGGIYSGGYGCAAFAFLLSDAAFGELPARMHADGSKIRVGDILRVNHDTHSVIVLAVSDTEVTIAEGNFNSSVFWGRKLSRTDLQGDGEYIITRYPETEPKDAKSN